MAFQNIKLVAEKLYWFDKSHTKTEMTLGWFLTLEAPTDRAIGRLRMEIIRHPATFTEKAMDQIDLKNWCLSGNNSFPANEVLAYVITPAVVAEGLKPWEDEPELVATVEPERPDPER